MINISNKNSCCGCSSCVQACPKHCIKLEEDEQGFHYPIVDKSLCIDCGLCEKVCPYNCSLDLGKYEYVYAAKSCNIETQLNSSSGGVFYELSKNILQREGCVFGAIFDGNFNVRHSCIDDISKLSLLMGSKYSQSYIGNTFSEAKVNLQSGRIVLFSGTPCQIHGLKAFLRKDYENLYTVEIGCHGVPSPKIWREWLAQYVARHSINQIHAINFRDKHISWNDYALKIFADDKIFRLSRKKNPYMLGFVHSLYVRPSCFNCPSKGKFIADITLCDFWGIQKCHTDLYDSRGVSGVFVNTEKGKLLFNVDSIHKTRVEASSILNYNPALYSSLKVNPQHEKFWIEYSKHGIMAINQCTRCYHVSTLKKIIIKVKKFF